MNNYNKVIKVIKRAINYAEKKIRFLFLPAYVPACICSNIKPSVKT